MKAAASNETPPGNENETNLSGPAARDYSDKLALTDHFHAPLLAQMAAWLKVGASSRILDAGCGAGGMTELLARAAPGVTVAAFDVSEAHLRATQSRTAFRSGATAVSPHAGSTEALPFADHSFDLVWCSRVLHGFRDPRLSLREFRRVLKSEGSLAVREDFPAQRLLPFEVGLTRPGLKDRIRAFYAGQYAAWHDRPSYNEGWLAMLREAGFERVRAKTFLLEQLPPFNGKQTAYLGRLLASWREDADLSAALKLDDQKALMALTDASKPTYALLRSDLYLLEGATVYLGDVNPALLNVHPEASRLAFRSIQVKPKCLVEPVAFLEAVFTKLRAVSQ